MSNQERDKLKETVKNNTRVIWHLKRQISALLDTFKVSTKQLEQYIFDESLKTVNFNVDEFQVSLNSCFTLWSLFQG